MYKLFLDDVRNPKDVKWILLPFEFGPWVIVRNYNEFIKVIKEKGLPEFISFDHDLAEEHYRPSMYNPDRHYTKYYNDGTFKEATGYHCAEWLVKHCIAQKKKIPNYSVHSLNPIGKENIFSVLESGKKVLESVIKS